MMNYGYFRFSSTVVNTERSLALLWSWRNTESHTESFLFESFNDCLRDAQKSGLRLGELADELSLGELLERGRHLSASADYLTGEAHGL